MKNKFLKWWNREWGNWEEFNGNYKVYDTPDGLVETLYSIQLKRTSNDGLIEFKTVKV
jgi:hypothetical protein